MSAPHPIPDIGRSRGDVESGPAAIHSMPDIAWARSQMRASGELEQNYHPNRAFGAALL